MIAEQLDLGKPFIFEIPIILTEAECRFVNKQPPPGVNRANGSKIVGVHYQLEVYKCVVNP
jgi:hypothetical protein